MGNNGQGKSNFLEAIYMLSVAKSYRGNTERDLITEGSVNGLSYSKIACDIQLQEKSTKLEIHYQCEPFDNKDGFVAQKFIKINGIPKRATDFVGNLNSVLFSVAELDLVFGTPSSRRRYLNILISQIDKIYLKNLLDFQKINSQRNSLLKLIREGNSQDNELSYWDSQSAKLATDLIIKRVEILENLSNLSNPIHKEMSNLKENMYCSYLPSTKEIYPMNPEKCFDFISSQLISNRSRDISAGTTSIGPHRDDFQIFINDLDSHRFSSRGQARTAVLALKFAEAEILKRSRNTTPILLLDDLLSELDLERREQILDMTTMFDQSIITTAEPEIISQSFKNQSNLLEINNGEISEKKT